MRALSKTKIKGIASTQFEITDRSSVFISINGWYVRAVDNTILRNRVTNFGVHKSRPIFRHHVLSLLQTMPLSILKMFCCYSISIQRLSSRYPKISSLFRYSRCSVRHLVSRSPTLHFGTQCLLMLMLTFHPAA